MFCALVLSLHLANTTEVAQLMAHLDLNQDGVISQPESVFNLILMTHFKQVDLDKDGKISLFELEQRVVIKPKQDTDSKQHRPKVESH